jgi:hypothetical protein
LITARITQPGTLALGIALVASAAAVAAATVAFALHGGSPFPCSFPGRLGAR